MWLVLVVKLMEINSKRLFSRFIKPCKYSGFQLPFPQLVSESQISEASTCFPFFPCFPGGNFSTRRTLLSISVPPEVQPGQMLAVKVPDGRELTVVVPNGARQDRKERSGWWQLNIFF